MSELSRLGRAPTRAKGMVHKLISDTAKGCCLEAWEQLAKQNAFYKKFPTPERFVTGNWPKYIPVARAILTGMLGNPNYDEKKKAVIHEALLLDGAVNPKRMGNTGIIQ